jgi:hypothetical protein
MLSNEELIDWLHSNRLHPDFEYETTSGPRKAWGRPDIPPDGDGWELNICSRHDDAWERFDHHEERYWRRIVPEERMSEIDQLRARVAELEATIDRERRSAASGYQLITAAHFDWVKRIEEVISYVPADVNEWQRGYRDCAKRVAEALTPPGFTVRMEPK